MDAGRAVWLADGVPSEEAATNPPVIHDYELLRLVGRGSYGDVWLARGATGLLRAIKIVWRNRFSDASPYEREFSGLREFARSTVGESRQMALLHVGRNERQGFFYYVMELADDVVTGREIDPNCYAPLTFKVIRDRDRFLPAAELVPHAIELARSLAELHGMGLIHRDIKPSNIILVDGRPKLADVGLVAVPDQALTFVGTEGFVPPEGPGTMAADIYSFGKVLYELATGCDRNDFPRLPADLSVRTDRRELLELNEIIVKACTARASERYPDVATMLGELRLLEAGKSVRRLRFAEAGLARARRWLLVGLVATVVAVIGALIERERANVASAGRRAAEQELADLTRRTLYTSSIANAQRWISLRDFGPARAALQAVVPAPDEPDLRGFEWYALAIEAAGDPATIIRPNGSTVESLHFSPDDRILAVDDASTSVELYDLASGRLILTVPGLHRLAGFTPDGERLVGTTPTYEIETWSVHDGSPDPRPNQPGIFRPLAVARHAAQLAYFEDSNTDEPHHFGIRDLRTDRDIARWPLPRFDETGKWWAFRLAALDDDLSRLALILQSGVGHQRLVTTSVWDLTTGQKVANRTFDSVGPDIPHLSVSPNGRSLYYFDSGVFNAFDTSTMQPVWPRPIPMTQAFACVVSPDGKWVASGSMDKSVTKWNFDPDSPPRHYYGQLQVPIAWAWTSDSQQLASGSRAGDVMLWGANVHTALPNTGQIESPADGDADRFGIFDRDGGFVLVTSLTGTACRVDTATLEATPLALPIYVPLWSEKDETWWLGQDGLLHRTRALSPDQDEILPICDPAVGLYRAAISADGNWIVGHATNNVISIWDRRHNRLANRLPLTVATGGLAFDPDGNVIIANQNQSIQIWNSATGALLRERQINSRPVILLSPDGRWIVLQGSADSTEVVRASDLTTVATIRNSYQKFGALAFSPDSRILACGAIYGTVRLFDTATWQERPSLLFNSTMQPVDANTIVQVCFSPDGHQLLATNLAGGVRIWRTSEASAVPAPAAASQ